MRLKKPANLELATPDKQTSHPLSENWHKIIKTICITLIICILIFMLISPAIQKIISNSTAEQLVDYFKSACLYIGGIITAALYNKVFGHK
jgi:hypothetical protein